jgi:C-terminal processing protease CtpA/Prc
MNRKDLQKMARMLGGIPVWSTLEGSVAHEAGLRSGDVILSVNGRPTPTIGDYFSAKAVNRKEMVLTYFRGGATQTITVAFSGWDTYAARAEVIQRFVNSRAVALVGSLAKRHAN